MMANAYTSQPLTPQEPDMIRVITIDREYGSGGADIAKALADRLGWKLWDQALTNEIARYMECDCRVVEEHEEKRDPLYYRLLKSFVRGSYEGSQNAHRIKICLLYTSDAADEEDSVDLGGRRIIKK